MEGELWIYLGYCVGAVAFSFLINSLFLKFASNLGTRDTPQDMIRWSAVAKPSVGGFSFFILFLVSIIFYQILFEQQSVVSNTKLLGVFSATTLAFLMGLSDDAYNTKPILKFIAQISCAVILIITGTSIAFFGNVYLNYALTIFWVVGMMNSVNMLDNMDSITSVTSMATILNAMLLIYLGGDYADNIYMMLLVGVLAALIGFLPHNWNPAKMFMGDTGSQFLGMFLAAIGILYFWNAADMNGEYIQSKQVLMTLLAFAIPIIDTTTVVINRLLKGNSPFVGGKDHTTHCLHFMGLSEKNIARLYFFIGLISILLNYCIFYTQAWSYTHTFLYSGYFIALFLCLYLPTRKYGKA
jgi:UDP-GlcNAc:undecaprenyl-phosphate/decaprenyl-phosphate GlcNAc-1-phosphate transferase